MKSGNLNFLEPSGPLQACKGTALLDAYLFDYYFMPLICIHNCVSAQDSLFLPSRIWNVEIESRDCLVLSSPWGDSLLKKTTVVNSSACTVVQAVPLLRLLRSTWQWQCRQMSDIPVLFVWRDESLSRWATMQKVLWDLETMIFV
jgi:hypothetical protein